METILDFLNRITDVADSIVHYDYSGIIFWLQMLAVFVSTFLVYGIIYSIVQTGRIFNKIHIFMRPAPTVPYAKKNLEEWQEILERGKSDDENKRKFAIIAADALIERILAAAGYDGENLAERLKKIEPSDFDSLNSIWDAHKIRNRIAHEADYKLQKNDAVVALSNYEKALKELEYI